MKILILIGALVLLGAIIAGLYFFVEKPTQEEALITGEVNVYAYEGTERVKTGYSIYLDNVFHLNGTTNEFVAVRHNILANRSLIVFNTNIEGQDYYVDTKELFIKNTTRARMILKLEKRGNLSIKQEGKLGDSDIKLNVTSEGIFKDYIFCLKWSQRFIYVKIEGFERILNEDYDKCFLGNYSLQDGESFVIPLKVSEFGEVQPGDYIKLYFINDEKIPFKSKKEEILLGYEIQN